MDNKNRNENRLSDIAYKALAVGAGAALLYRSGGYKALSSGLRRLSNALDETMDTVSKTALKDMDAKFVSNAISGFKKAFSEVDDKITLRSDRPESLFNAITEMYQMAQNKSSRLYPIYDDANIRSALKHQFQDLFGTDNPDFTRRAEYVIDDFVDHINSAISYNNDAYEFSSDFLERHFKNNIFNEEQQAQMLDMLTDALERRKEEAAQFVEEHKALADEMLSKFDFENLASYYGRRGEETSKQKLFDKITGDRAATVSDLLENRDKLGEFKIFGLSDEKGRTDRLAQENAMDVLAKLVEKDARYGDIFVDPYALRINEAGELYSFVEAASLKNRFLEEFAQTLPGKLFKTRDYLEIKKAPIYRYIGPGSADPILAKLAEGHDSVLLNNPYVRILDKTYRINLKDNTLEYLSDLDNTYLISGEHGTANRLLKSIVGDVDRKPLGNSRIRNALELGYNAEPSKLKRFTSIFTKFNDPRWSRNLVNSFLTMDENELMFAIQRLQDATDSQEKKAIEQYIGQYFDKAKKLDSFLNQTTRKLDRTTVNKLLEVIPDNHISNAKDMLKLLNMKDEDMINELMQHNFSTFKNKELQSLVKRYLKDSDSARRAMSIVSDNKAIIGTTRAVSFTEMIRKEIAKEAFLSYRDIEGSNLSVIKLLESAGLESTRLKEAKYLANWAILKDTMKNYTGSGVQDINDIAKRALNVQSLFSGLGMEDQEFAEAFRENIETMVKEHASVIQRGFQRDQNIIPGHRLGRYTTMQKSVGVLDMLQNINDQTKVKAFFKQFVAGRDNLEDVTSATMFPYFMLHRLVEGVSDIGLGFTAKSTGSTIDLAKNIMLKRVLPIAGALTTLSYLDYEAKNFTGTSLRGAAANSLANLDLFGRRISDAIGLTSFRKSAYELNPIRQYLNNGQPYHSYEERKEWYERGYTPVRKSRWWSFGSDSEYRGSKIDYFQPNYLRRAHSDWRDIGVYGSSKEKWQHSWIPTPRHPFSPIRALLDPYWLERKHYWDRPYPVTGKLFEEGTPWGAILNPTIGQIIKPQRRMHQAELGNTLVDVRTLIAQRNQEIREKADANNSLVKLDGTGTFTPVSYTPLGAPTGSETVLSLDISGGKVSNYYVTGSEYQAMSVSEYEPTHDMLQARAIAIATGERIDVNNINPNLPVTQRVQLAADRGNIIAGVVRNMIPIDIISSVNESIKAKAISNAPDRNEGIISPDAIFKTSARDKSLIVDPNFAADLRNVTSTRQFLEDAGYSAKELSGMYGFLIDELLPTRKSARLQSADRMASFTRRFWDESLGGLGGEFMEIVRRFIPHEDHNINRINPIRNTMPDWMPERFKLGDPYEKLPKGEMRLPGKAYESINQLHPDQYGRYGAFDRMKILADIAPWSSEYRLWRDIANKTVQDPNLRKEMEEIRERVNQQSKQHDFYPYKFLGVKLDETSGVVESVDNHGFTLVGNDVRYKVAGVKFTEGSLKDFLAPGTNVRLRFDRNDANQKSISAIVIAEGENLNRRLLNSGRAEKSKDDSPIALHARYSQSQIDRAKINELIAHAPIPLIHRKFLRINTPLESLKDEHIYGVPYATWSHPIQGFVIPAINRAFSVSHTHAAIGMTSWVIAEKIAKTESAGAIAKGVSKVAFLLSNPGAFAGAVGGFITRLDGKYVNAGARIGAAIGLAGYAYTNSNNPIFSTGAGAIIGREIAEQFWKGTGKRGAAIGAAAGLALSALKNPSLDLDNMFGPWIPEKVKKRWEIEEYFDRLKYIKYMGLYEKAAKLAKRKENVDIKRLINKYEYDSEKREKIRQQLLANKQLISNTYLEGDERREAMLADIDAKLEALSYPEQILKAGKYTKAAIAYKQAAESTVYGLKKNATWSQVLRAVPKYERDYILEFGQETDPKRRKEILKYISPYRRKVLQILWGEEPTKVKTNREFFANHQLPGVFWAGWQPDIDLDKVAVKTIKNEGMLLSDFGFYESEAEDIETIMAPEVDYDRQTSPLELRKNLLAALNGAGLIGVDVSIEPSSQPGIQMVANIIRINEYKIKQKVNSITGRIFY